MGRLTLVPFRGIEDPSKLRRVLEATLLIEANLELPEVLRHVIEEACSMTGARYGALGVLDEEKRALCEFVTVGLSVEEEDQIGPRPTGRGVLGLLIADPRPLRIHEIGRHPDSFGFPAGHPPMTSFLGVPIKVRDEVYGNLYLAEKVGWTEFTQDDEALVGALSLAAGIAIENARLHERVRRSAVYEDRDPRGAGPPRHCHPAALRARSHPPGHGSAPTRPSSEPARRRRVRDRPGHCASALHDLRARDG